MAAIDKTYFRTWNQYREVCDWADDIGKVTDDYGNTFRPADFIFPWTEEDYKISYLEQINHDLEPRFVLWNTPVYFDVWLIRNCPIELIQIRLHEQYSDYDDIKDHTSIYDKPRHAGSHKFKIQKVYDIKYKNKKSRWWIQIVSEPEGTMYFYNEHTNMWYDICECKDITSNVAIFSGHMSKRKLARLIRHWDLPVGVTLSFEQMKRRYIMKKFLVKIV